MPNLSSTTSALTDRLWIQHFFTNSPHGSGGEGCLHLGISFNRAPLPPTVADMKLGALLLTGIVFSGTLVADERDQVVPVKPTLSWYSDFDEALVASKKSGMPILLEFR